MNRLAGLVLAGLLVTVAATPASAGDTATKARGIVTAIRGEWIMINLPNDMDLAFRVDGSTSVVARGAGTKTRQAKSQGAPGVKLLDIVPIGAEVEISFEQRGGIPYAKRIYTIAADGGR